MNPRRTASPNLSRAQDVVETRRHGGVALEMREAQSAVVVEVRDPEAVLLLDDELDRGARVLGGLDGCLENVAAVRGAVDREYLHALGQLGLVGGAVLADREPDRVAERGPLAVAVHGLGVLIRRVVEHELVAAARDSAERRR